MSTYSTLKQHSEERARLVQAAAPAAAAVILGRRRVLSAIQWRADLIVTAAEALEGAERVGVRFEGESELDAEVIATDLGTDTAILRIGTRRSFPARADQELRVGELVAVVGRTLRGPAALWGSVRLAGPAWSSRRGGRIDQRLELDVGFDLAFEGAAVIDATGAVAAMAVPGPYSRVLAIPAGTIESVISRVEKLGHLPKPYIGIRLQTLWLDDDTRTRLGRKSRGIAAIGGVDPGSPAAAAGIELGDLLLTVEGEPLEGVNALAGRIAGSNPGQTLAVEVLRGGKPLALNVQVGERPRG